MAIRNIVKLGEDDAVLHKRACREALAADGTARRIGSAAVGGEVEAIVRERIARAVASGFDEQDVRRRIAQQITDAERIEQSDVVFNNDGTKEELYNKVVAWWNEYNAV